MKGEILLCGIFIGTFFSPRASAEGVDLRQNNDTVWMSDLLVAPFEDRIDQLRRQSELARRGINSINQGDLDEFEEELLSEYKEHVQEGFIFQAVLIEFALLRDDEELFLFVLDHLDVLRGFTEYNNNDAAVDRWFRGVLKNLMEGVDRFPIDEDREKRLLDKAISFANEGETEQSDGKLHLAHFFFNLVVLANEESGRAWNGLGRIHELAGDLEGALTFYKKAEENEWSGGIRSQFMLFMRHHRYDEVYEILPKVKGVFDQDLDVQILFFGFSVAVGDREVFQWAYRNADLNGLQKSRTEEEYSVVALGLDRFGAPERDSDR